MPDEEPPKILRGGRFMAGQVYFPGIKVADVFYPGFKKAQLAESPPQAPQNKPKQEGN